jgi:hypothetical protein
MHPIEFMKPTWAGTRCACIVGHRNWKESNVAYSPVHKVDGPVVGLLYIKLEVRRCSSLLRSPNESQRKGPNAFRFS